MSYSAGVHSWIREVGIRKVEDLKSGGFENEGFDNDGWCGADGGRRRNLNPPEADENQSVFAKATPRRCASAKCKI
jgi:hypothetical protein